MVDLSEFFGTGKAMLLVGAVLLYAASRACVEALAGKESSPGWRAVGHWIPIAVAAIVAVAMRRGDLALSIIFATSVGCLSLLLGSICIMSPDAEIPAAYRRFWPFVLPAALLALVSGFAGYLSLRHALFFLIEGCALMFVWQEIRAGESEKIGELEFAEKPRRKSGALRMVNVVLCVLVAVIGAIAGIIGAKHLSQDIAILPDTATIVGVMAPMLVLPMLAGGAALAQNDRAWAAVTSGIGVVLLNICLLLPIVILIWYPLQGIKADGLHAIHLDFSAIRHASPFPYGWVTWRVDSVVLLVLSFVLFPVSMGRWKLGRPEGLTLIVLYAVYVIMEAAGSLRS